MRTPPFSINTDHLSEAASEPTLGATPTPVESTTMQPDSRLLDMVKLLARQAAADFLAGERGCCDLKLFVIWGSIMMIFLLAHLLSFGS